MDSHLTNFFSVEIVSEHSKLYLTPEISYYPVPSKLYFDCLVDITDLPPSIFYKSITLSFQSSSGDSLIEKIYNSKKALKCYDGFREITYFLFYSDYLVRSLVLTQMSFNELCAEPATFHREMEALASDKVKEIKFKSALKDSIGYYRAYFEKFVELVNNQQREILKLTDDLNNLKQVGHGETECESLSKCLVCEKDRRNVVFVPCGHVVVCLKCLNGKMGIKPSTLTAKKAMKCISCKKRIKIAHEVYF